MSSVANHSSPWYWSGTALAFLVVCPRPAAAQTADVQLTPVAEIGCESCEGLERFGVVTSVALGHGRVVVADRDAPHVRVFRMDGSPVAALAPEGEGPGELRYPLAIGISAEGIAVMDMQLRRIVLLDHAGEERGRGPAGSFPLAAAFEPGGEDLYIAVANFVERTAGVECWVPGDRTTEVVIESVEDIQLGLPGEPPLFFSIARAPDGGLAIGEGREAYDIQLFGPDGEAHGRITRDLTRSERTAAEIDEERERLERGLARLGVSPAAVRSRPEFDHLRRHYSVDALRYDGRGRLWVRTDRGRDETVFDVFDSRRAYLGEVTVTGRITAFGLGDGHLAAAVLDEWDIATVYVWRVQG
jgi:hypothetical protein